MQANKHIIYDKLQYKDMKAKKNQTYKVYHRCQPTNSKT